MIRRLEEDEEILWEVINHPKGFSEIMFSNLDNLMSFNEELSEIRLYQESVLSYEYCIDEDERLTKQENFDLKKSAGELYCYGARKWGKTLVVILLDILTSCFLLDGWDSILTSFDAVHVRSVLSKVTPVIENHPIYNGLKQSIKQTPTWLISLKNGFVLNGVNMNIVCGDRAGDQFFGHHVKKVWVEEDSKTSALAESKMVDAVSEQGCIAEGSMVLMHDYSTKPIEEVVPGDKIIALDETMGALVQTEVIHSQFQGIKDVINISCNENDLWLTPDHRIRTTTGGMQTYGWREAIKCTLHNLKAQTIRYINNHNEYLRGVLYGLLDSDGQICKYKTKKDNEILSYRLHQSEACEYEYILYLLNILGIEYTDMKYNPRPETYSKKPMHLIRIRSKHKQFIEDIKKDFESGKSIDFFYGYLSGFVLGDGHVSTSGALGIDQSHKKNLIKCQRIEKALCLTNINYNKYLPKNKDGMTSYVLNKYQLPFCLPRSKKGQIYLKRSLGVTRFYWNRTPGDIKLNGFKPKVKVYDLQTGTGNFIANGLIVHNCVFRRSGMTDITKHSPAGKLFYGPKQERICNLPQMVNPTWNKLKKEEAIKKYHGEHSNNYRIYVDGEVIEDGVSAIDMDRVRKFCYNTDKEIKAFELTKENYNIFKNVLVLEVPKGTDELFLCGDIGTSAPSELILIARRLNKFYYLYNITLYGLTHKEQFEVFKHIIDTLKVSFVGIDTGDGTGLAIYKELTDHYDEKNIFPYNGSGKLTVGLEKDDEGKIVVGPDGKPKELRENMRSWGVQVLKTIFYEGQIEIPLDLKFDIQMNSIISTRSGAREIFECTAEQDHLFDAFVVFGATRWNYEYSNGSSINKKKFFKGGV